MPQKIIDINRAPGQAQASFYPTTLNVSNGDQISWRNNDERPPNSPLNPDPDPQAHWPAPVGGKDTDWFPSRIPGKPQGFDSPMSQGVVTFQIPGSSQSFQYRDATGNTSAVGTIIVWNPAPPPNVV
jgi:plastocyanin